MVGVKDEKRVEHLGNQGIDFIRFAGIGEHHVQKIPGITQGVLRIGKRLSDGFFVTVGCDGGKLRQEAMDGDFNFPLVLNIELVLVKSCERAHNGTAYGHGVRVIGKPVV